jgi:hypothetical protein
VFAGSLLSMLSGAKPAKGSSSNGAAAAGAGSSSSSSRQMTGRDLEHLQQLHVFFNSLVDDMSANVQRLALRGFNTWLVGGFTYCAACVTVCTRQVCSLLRSACSL